jgi:hypothetical protein
MEQQDTKTITQGINAADKEVTGAETEVAIRKRQLRELAPQRKTLEQECLDDFECPIAELNTTLDGLKEEAAVLLIELEAEIKILKPSSDQE